MCAFIDAIPTLFTQTYSKTKKKRDRKYYTTLRSYHMLYSHIRSQLIRMSLSQLRRDISGMALVIAAIFIPAGVKMKKYYSYGRIAVVLSQRI
jgi:hypothetical protein